MNLRKKTFERDDFTCQKCSTSQNAKLEAHHINLRSMGGKNELNNLITLCSICHYLAPNGKESFATYIAEKIDGNILNSFRKYKNSIAERTTFGMERKFQEGEAITKPPLGYIMINKKLIIEEQNAARVRSMYALFLEGDLSLTKLAKIHSVSVNGLKKILSNRAYLGEVKFAGKGSKGTHKVLLDSELFEQVQQKLRTEYSIKD